MSFLPQFGNPSNTVRPPGSPPCWSQSFAEFDSTCRNCPYSSSCKDSIIRREASRVQAPALPTWNPQPAVPIPPAAPVRWGAPAIPAPVIPPAPLMPQPVSQPVNGLMRFAYGAVQDPMMMAFAAVPSPFRKQLEGETFVERVGKNMFLSAVEAVLEQGLLGVRGYYWPPEFEVQR